MYDIFVFLFFFTAVEVVKLKKHVQRKVNKQNQSTVASKLELFTEFSTLYSSGFAKLRGIGASPVYLEMSNSLWIS